MPFKKGQSGNPAGRAKGDTYKMSTEQRNFLRDVLRKNKRKFILQLKDMKGKDFVQNYIILMQYVLPKPATAPVKEVPELEEFIAMTPEERQVVMNDIRDNLNEGKQGEA
jgi:uncharacterized protein YlxP (DUF503 family)